MRIDLTLKQMKTSLVSIVKQQQTLVKLPLMGWNKSSDIQLQTLISSLCVTSIDVEHNSIQKRVAHSFFLKDEINFTLKSFISSFCNSGLRYLYHGPSLNTSFKSKDYRFKKSSIFLVLDLDQHSDMRQFGFILQELQHKY